MREDAADFAHALQELASTRATGGGPPLAPPAETQVLTPPQETILPAVDQNAREGNTCPVPDEPFAQEAFLLAKFNGDARLARWVMTNEMYPHVCEALQHCRGEVVVRVVRTLARQKFRIQNLVGYLQAAVSRRMAEISCPEASASRRRHLPQDPGRQAKAATLVHPSAASASGGIALLVRPASASPPAQPPSQDTDLGPPVMDDATTMVCDESQALQQCHVRLRTCRPTLVAGAEPATVAELPAAELPIVTVIPCAGLCSGEVALLKCDLQPAKIIAIEQKPAAVAVIQTRWPHASVFRSFEEWFLASRSEVSRIQAEYPSGVLWWLWTGPPCQDHLAPSGLGRWGWLGERSSTAIRAWKVYWEIKAWKREVDRFMVFTEMIGKITEDTHAVQFLSKHFGVPLWRVCATDVGNQCGDRVWGSLAPPPADGLTALVPAVQTLFGDEDWEWRFGHACSWTRPRPLRPLGTWEGQALFHHSYLLWRRSSSTQQVLDKLAALGVADGFLEVPLGDAWDNRLLLSVQRAWASDPELREMIRPDNLVERCKL